MRKLLTSLLALGVGVLGACGGGHSSPPAITVAVSPSTVNVIAGQTQQFTAAVSNSTNSAVTWSLAGSGCTGASCGTIDNKGLYTAPSPIAANATVTVTATSSADSSKSGTAKIVEQPVSLAITPNGAQTLISADTKQFSVTVSNAPSGHTGSTWTVTGGGTIGSNGLYTAPAKVINDATVTVTATSDFDNTKTASITITLKAPVITLSPGNTLMEAGGQLLFTATVTNVPAGQNGVTWALNGQGSLLSGTYQAPNLVSASMTANIQAVLVFDSSKVAHSVVTIDPVTIGVTPKVVTLYPGQTQQFSAAVANHVNKAVSWSTSSTACTGAACGTIDQNGLYTAPANIVSDLDVNVAGASVADASKADTAIVHLKPITVTVSPKTATVNVGMTQQFSATVQGGTNLNVTWSVQGSGCSGNACGTIGATTGLYTAPNAPPTPPTVTVTATSVADPSRTDAANVTIVYDPNVKLNGNFAFSFTGWDSNGSPLDAIGSMVADANGHLSGTLDMNGLNSTSHTYHALKQSFTGTYQMHASGNRGLMTISTTEAFTFRFVLNSTGDRGQMLLFEPSGRYGAGSFKRQTPSDFSLAKLNGDYVMGLSGLSVYGDERNVAIARGHLNGAGAISNTSLDVSNTAGPTAHVSFTGSVAMSSTTGMSSGRGTVSVTASGSTVNFSYYMVDATEAFMMVTDATGANSPLLIGKFLKQTGSPFSAASLNGPVVLYMTGIVQKTPILTSVFVGRFGVTNGSGPGEFFENWGGQLVDETGSTIYANIDSTGRATLTSSSFSDSFVAYFVAPNTGFIMEYTTPNGGPMRFGFFEPQSSGPFTVAALNGEYFGGALDPATSSVRYGNGIQNWGGTGAWSGTGNTTGPGIGQTSEQYVAGTYDITSATTGAGDWALTSSGSYYKKFYVISPNKIVFVSAETSETSPVLEIFEK